MQQKERNFHERHRLRVYMLVNSRTVLLLTVTSKVCERVALNQLTTYVDNNKRLTEHQSDNKKLHSCETLNVMMTRTRH